MIFQIFFIFLLILLNGIFAMVEMAISTITTIELNDEITNNSKYRKKAQDILNIKKKPTSFLALIQIGITLFGLLNGFLAADTFAEKLLINLSLSPDSVNAYKQLVGIFITILIGLGQVICGELVPKRIGTKYKKGVAFAFIDFFKIFHIVFYPLVWLLTSISNLIARIFKIKPTDELTIQIDDLMATIHSGATDKAITEEQEDIVENVINIANKRIKDVMTKEENIEALEINSSESKILEFILDDPFSRIPVYEEELNNIKGILYIKSLMKPIINKEPIDLRAYLNTPLIVSQEMKSLDLFNQMKESEEHYQIALVKDARDNIVGLVTLEDLLEEIVGEIYDEQDKEVECVTKISDNEYKVSAQEDLDDVLKDLSLEISSDHNSLADYIVYLLGDFPDENKENIVEDNQAIYKVTKIENEKILEVLVTLKNELLED
jgi:putative hemolysin